MMIIKNGHVIDPSQNLDGEYDILIENEKISAIDKPGAFHSKSGAKVMDAKGLTVTPGLIDVHVHLREPGFESKETIASGLRAAVAGGFTSVACMANTSPVNDNPFITRFILDRSCEAALSRVFPIGAVTKGLKGEELAEIGFMKEAGAVALSDDGMPIMNSELMRRAMDYARTFDLPIISHAEDLNLSKGAPMSAGAVSSLLGYRGNPNASEEIMVAREIALARMTGARVHIAHLSTREAVEQVRRAKEAGVRITAEVTPHHLMLSDRAILNCAHACDRTDHKMAPPLRSGEDQEALIRALEEGVIDMIASDHAPHGCVDKQTEFELAANGILGLQTTLPLILELVAGKKLSMKRAIQALTSAPAQLIGQKQLGTMKVGSAGDFTLIDLTKRWKLEPSQIFSKSTNSPFKGREFNSRVAATIVGGQIKFQAEQNGVKS